MLELFLLLLALSFILLQSLLSCSVQISSVSFPADAMPRLSVPLMSCFCGHDGLCRWLIGAFSVLRFWLSLAAPAVT